MEPELNKYERIDDLECKGYRIIQDKRKFCFGMDAVLISNFAAPKPKDKVVDLGTGTGIIPILLAAKSDALCIKGIEIQEDMAHMAKRSVILNGLQDRIEIVKGDIREAALLLGRGKYDLVVSNPPYKKWGSGIINPSDGKAIARHEILCTLNDVLSQAASLLKFGGRFVMVHRPERLIDILYSMRESRLEPKRIRLVYPDSVKPPNLVLIEGILGGKPNLLWMPPLFVYDGQGQYTNDIRDIYYGDDK